MTKFFERWKARRQTRHELSMMADRELWDIGITRGDIERIVSEIQ